MIKCDIVKAVKTFSIPYSLALTQTKTKISSAGALKGFYYNLIAMFFIFQHIAAFKK